MRKRIVLLSAFLSPLRSGAEAMVEEVSVRLADDFDLTIITGRYSRNVPTRDTLREKVTVIRIGFGHPIDKYLFPILAPFAAARCKPVIIHAVLESYAGLAMIFCRFIVPRAKRVLTLQSTNTSFLLQAMHQSAHRITAISSVLIERARSFGHSDVTLIPNGIDLVSIREACRFHAKDSSLILFVGRLELMKGIDILLRAFAQAIVGLSPDIHLRIVGDGSLLRDLQKLAVELEIDHRVVFVGRVSPKAVLDEFAKAEIFCGLSRSEALGNVFLEAQAADCAVLATRTGGIPDIVVDGVSGLLVPVNDVSAAAAALKNLLQDVPLRARLARDGKKSVERYDWQAISAEYAKIYESCSL